MDLPEVKPVLAKDFVACWVDTDRTVGGVELLEKMRAAKGGGIPWFVFLEPDGKPMVDADDVFGQNLGCPHTEKEVEAWGETLRRARKRISDAELARVMAAFHEAGERGELRREAERKAAEGAGAAGR